MYNCKRCGFENKYKCRIINHLKSKKPCSTILSNIDRELLINILNQDKATMEIDNKKVFICKYCKKVYKSAEGKSRHSKKCKDKFNNNLNNTINDSSNNSINIINNDSFNNTINNNDSSNNIINNKDSSNNIINNNDLSTNITNNNDQSINTNTNIMNNSNNTTNNTTNNNIKNLNNNFNNNNININDVNNLNAFLEYHKINLFSFPTYSIGFLVEKNFKSFLKQINKSRQEDLNPETAFRSNYNFIMNIFKEILLVDDIRTKNLYINELTDNHAYCLIERKFYKISLEDLFNIIFSHMPNIIFYLLKLKDTFNGLDDNDKKYAKDACINFEYFLENSDKTEFKKIIVDCIYNNKLILQDLLNSAKPQEALNKNNDKTLAINSRIINNLRKKLGIKPIDLIKNDILTMKEKDIKTRFKNSIKIHENNNDLDNEIYIDYDNTETKHFSDGTICYKTTYRGFDIWFNETHNIGAICSKNDHTLYSKETLEKHIDYMIDFISGNKPNNEINTINLSN